MPNFIGKFKRGMKVGKETHLEFELREMTTADMLDAEMEVSAGKPINFSAALASMQLVRVGSYDGPFTFKMVRGLHPDDFNLLRDALNEVALLGEGSLPSKATG
jgi:phage FluMu protein gp41